MLMYAARFEHTRFQSICKICTVLTHGFILQGRWICSQCTLANNPIRRTCETCGAARGELPRDNPGQQAGQAQAGAGAHDQPGLAQQQGVVTRLDENVSQISDLLLAHAAACDL